MDEPEPAADGVEVVAVDAGRGPVGPLATYLSGHPLATGRALRRVLERDFDVIHYHNPSLVTGPGGLAYGSALKLFTLHEQWLVCPTHVRFRNQRELCERETCVRCTLRHRRPPQLWRLGRLLERSLHHVDALLAPSRTTAALHARLAPHVRIEDLPSFAPDPGPPGTARGSPTRSFLYAGRLEPVKGVATLLDAFRARPGDELWIAGDGSQAETLRHKARDMPNVRFLGQLSQQRIDEVYRRARALLLPTIGHESFPLVVVEALARGVPAIVRRRGALAEVAAEAAARSRTTRPPSCTRASTASPTTRSATSSGAAAGRRTRGGGRRRRTSRPTTRSSSDCRRAGGSRRRGPHERPPRVPARPARLPDVAVRPGRAGGAAAAQVPTLLVCDPDDVRHVFVANHRNYGKTRRLTSRRGRRLSGRGLLTSSGAEHRRRRRTLSPMFQRREVEPYASAAASAALEHAARWREGETVEAFAACADVALAARLRTLLSTSSDADLVAVAEGIRARQRWFERAFATLVPVDEVLPTARARAYARALDRVDKVLYAQIAARRREGGSDLLGALAAARAGDGRALSDEEIRDEALTLALTGHETIGDALAWTLWLVASHDALDERVARDRAGADGGRRSAAPLPADMDRRAHRLPRRFAAERRAGAAGIEALPVAVGHASQPGLVPGARAL